MGRAPLSRGVVNFEDHKVQPPAEVVLDTCFVVAALNASEPTHAAAVSYLSRLVSAQSLLVFNRLLEVELAEVAFKLAVKERHGSKNFPSKRGDGRIRRRAGRLMRDLLGSWHEIIGLNPSLCIELEEVSSDVPMALEKWGLASYDAVHALTAIYAGSPQLVTVDAGFGWVPENLLRVYVDSSRVAACRKRRGGSEAG